MDLSARPATLDVSTVDDPEALLRHAWALEPAMRLSERSAVLDRLEQLLAEGTAPAEPPGRSWRLELLAERAIDAARLNHLDEARELADLVLGDTRDDVEDGYRIAVARALEARGRALAWLGTDAATRRADRILLAAAQRYRDLGAREWEAFVLFWRGNTVYLQKGELAEAAELMRTALRLLGPDSIPRATVLSFYAELLISLGEWQEAEQALIEGAELADRDEDVKSQAYVSWSWARMASARGDVSATERYLRETERHAGDWFATHTGATFLADAAEMLDRVGLTEQAAKYLTRAVEHDPDDEFVRQAQAALLARSGDPGQALDALQELVRGQWLEKRWVWRHTLLTAWATFRAGRDGAGALAERALRQAESAGGVRVATATEPELVTALLPLAEAAGSATARRLLVGDRPLLVRLFGVPGVTRADGTPVELPAGQPAALVRLLAAQPYGLTVEEVAEWFFPDTPIAPARHRLRQILTRLRATSGELVVRDGDRLSLVPAWVDVREFIAAADRVGSARGARAVQLAYAALALWSGPPLPTDAYAEWAGPIRDLLHYRHLTLLDLITVDADQRGSHQEAVAALTAALEQDRHDRDRYDRLAEHLLSLGRTATAQYLAMRAGVDLDPRSG